MEPRWFKADINGSIYYMRVDDNGPTYYELDGVTPFIPTEGVCRITENDIGDPNA